MSSAPKIEEVMAGHGMNLQDAATQSLLHDLVAREDQIADQLRQAAQQFGLYPQIVAEVFAEFEIGSPISPEQRQLIRHQYIALMDQLQRQQGPGSQ